MVLSKPILLIYNMWGIIRWFNEFYFTVASCTGTCENGGTWNVNSCACDCQSGFTGKHLNYVIMQLCDLEY
jgi:hypothetical protein